MLLSEQSLDSVSVSKKQAETLYYFSPPKGRLNAHVQIYHQLVNTHKTKILIS
jgi:hypothetical protein